MDRRHRGYLRIPDADLDNLSKLAALPDASVEQLLSALARQRPPLSSHALASQIASEVPSIAADELTRLVDILMTLLAVRAGIDESTSDLADLVASNDRLGLSPEARSHLKQLLVRLLGLQPLVLAWKALDVLYEHEKRFHSARTITELRPLYGENVTEAPDGLVIAHSFKVTYHTSEGETADIFIGLDEKDVGAMMEVLQRAQDKARTLRDMMTRVGITVVAPMDDET